MQTQELEPIQKLTKDIKEAAYILSSDEARFLVDSYYQMQDNRIRAAGQIRSMTESGEPNEVLQWLLSQNTTLENQVKRALDAYSGSNHVGQWARNQKGIGPVIAAGLLAHIDIHKAPTVGHIWSFAGLDPNAKWKKGERRPWNAQLKVLCWKAGQSFVKISGDENALYGQIYKKRKEYEVAKNEAGDYADQAKAKLENFKIGKTTDAYKAYSKGILPPAHIQARVERYTVKIFLSNLHEVWYFHEFGELPPKPFAIAHLGHGHKIEPENYDCVPGLWEAKNPQSKRALR